MLVSPSVVIIDCEVNVSDTRGAIILEKTSRWR